MCYCHNYCNNGLNVCSIVILNIFIDFQICSVRTIKWLSGISSKLLAEFDRQVEWSGCFLYGVCTFSLYSHTIYPDAVFSHSPKLSHRVNWECWISPIDTYPLHCSVNVLLSCATHRDRLPSMRTSKIGF